MYMHMYMSKYMDMYMSCTCEQRGQSLMMSMQVTADRNLWRADI